MFKGILLTIALIASTTFAQIPESQPQSIWLSAYQSDWELAHKQYLTWNEETFDDAVHKQFFMAYVNYRAGDMEYAHRVFEMVDLMIDREIAEGRFSPSAQ